MNKTKYIAIVALDNKKTELIEWSYFNKDFLTPHKILALGSAANILDGTLNKKVKRSVAGKLGEFRDLVNLINDEQVDGVIIFAESEDILNSKDLSAVLEAAIRKNIIVAANSTSADFILHSTLFDAEYKIQKEEKKLTDNSQQINAAAA